VLNIVAPRQEPEAERQNDRAPCDVGVITVLSEEAQAVILALRLYMTQAQGLHFYETADSGESPIKVVMIQALNQGQRSAVAAYSRLCQHYDPKIVVLVGIGGGISFDVGPGDVVVATRVVYYDLRKQTPRGIQHSGEEREAPAEAGRAINAFFADHRPADFQVHDLAGVTRTMRMRHGLIGSGDALIAGQGAETLAFLAAFNDKILAIDMEAGGLSQASHERSAASRRPRNWAVIRGISDDAGPGQDDSWHHIASWHAAIALRKLLPYLTSSG
jgi:adenosylhomocysteine nucleosidase